jgi:hypothetical protein
MTPGLVEIKEPIMDRFFIFARIIVWQNGLSGHSFEYGTIIKKNIIPI